MSSKNFSESEEEPTDSTEFSPTSLGSVAVFEGDEKLPGSKRNRRTTTPPEETQLDVLSSSRRDESDTQMLRLTASTNKERPSRPTD